MAEAEGFGDYTCSACGGSFTRDKTLETALDEAKEVFGAFPSDPVEVCDDCYKRFMAWWNAMTPEQQKAIEEEARNAG